MQMATDLVLKWLRWIVSAFLSLMLLQCGQRTVNDSLAPTASPTSEADEAAKWAAIMASVVSINTYDDDRILEIGQGFFVDSQLVVARLSLFQTANRAVVKPHEGSGEFAVAGFVALDRISDLILLRIEGFIAEPLLLNSDSIALSTRTYMVSRPSDANVQLRTGKVEQYSRVNGLPVYQVSNQLHQSASGQPIFLNNRRVLGLAYTDVVNYRKQTLALPANLIGTLMEKQSDRPRPLSDTRSGGDLQQVNANSRIKGIRIETDLGNIEIRLFNEVPDYRDNFIRLAEEGYFNELLVHRVISGFGIQSGAADTRYAGSDDVVGWKGPGYTLPAHIQPDKFHRRGMVGSPRKPDRDNTRRRSDGSQYYIVTGRRYTQKELDEIEKENGYRFSSAQREVYTTVGGAPHLDGSYTLFGEVVSGLEIADKIATVEVGREFRPLQDIRVRRVSVMR